jgi:hypothetical protein
MKARRKGPHLRRQGNITIADHNKTKKENLENPQRKRKTPVNFTDITREIQKTAKSSRPDERLFFFLIKKN